MSSHARLLAYAETAKQTHPLILVVGREASKDASLVDGVGDYDFDTVDSRFWTTAYSTIASVAGTELYSLRAACRQRRSSPIVFADALPVGIDNNNDSKLALREQVTPEALDAHLSALLEMPILERVAVIVCAGHREGTRGSSTAEALFYRAFDALHNYAMDGSIQIVETPAMIGYNSPTIRNRLATAGPEGALSIAGVLAGFNPEASVIMDFS